MKYRNIKRFIRQANAQAKNEASKTGGGVVSKTLRFYIEEPAMIQLGALLTLTVFGHSSRYDDDAGETQQQQKNDDTMVDAPYSTNELENIFDDENEVFQTINYFDTSQIAADKEVSRINADETIVGGGTVSLPQPGTSKSVLVGSVVGAPPPASSTPTDLADVKDPALKKKWQKYTGALLKSRKNQLLATKRRTTTNDNIDNDEFIAKKIETLQSVAANAIRSREREDEMHGVEMQRAKYAAKREKYAMKCQKLKYRMLAERRNNNHDNNRTLSSVTSDTSDDCSDDDAGYAMTDVDHNTYPNSRNTSPRNNARIL